MFWTDWGSKARIERAYMSGAGRVTIVSTNIQWPNGVAIDFSAEKLYWTDAGNDKIERSNLDGSYRQVQCYRQIVVSQTTYRQSKKTHFIQIAFSYFHLMPEYLRYWICELISNGHKIYTILVHFISLKRQDSLCRDWSEMHFALLNVNFQQLAIPSSVIFQCASRFSRIGSVTLSTWFDMHIFPNLVVLVGSL